MLWPVESVRLIVYTVQANRISLEKLIQEANIESTDNSGTFRIKPAYQ